MMWLVYSSLVFIIIPIIFVVSDVNHFLYYHKNGERMPLLTSLNVIKCTVIYNLSELVSLSLMTGAVIELLVHFFNKL